MLTGLKTFSRRTILKQGKAAIAGVLSCRVLPPGPVFAAGGVLPVRQVADGIFAFAGTDALMTDANRGEICNVGFVIGGDGVAVIDSGGSVAEGRALIAAIRAVTDKPIAYLINTHMHPDHCFGNAAFEGTGAVLVGHHNLPRALASRGEFYLSSYRESMGEALMREIRIIPPTKLINDEENLDLGGRIIRLKAWKPAHTDNDLTVLDEKTGVLFTGDLCFIRHLPTLDGSLTGWIAQLEALKAIRAKIAVPGHGPVPAKWPDALEDERRYFEVLTHDIRQAIAAGVPLAMAIRTAAESERGNWHLFDAYNVRNATAAYAELEWE
ncbi:quinoprotein relay system zinc metallohydrolase 2 [Phyllobacterium salinisoli]|uniref:Quinoprotein relay system zinc metallohydrolase 2 n=1 Tax=Phyllobacterium salinisoli TaxID=1899321 RepID=A0A368K5J5_9HYPH|nr:quinoprotein relay system zinc metallohydrolase 2 [Phyllobacterium salinisoli]RCS24464.1 quinoprotein relay system zinc metallohydrolase 2 [Phyllobacterium salinisoli]